MNYTNIIMLMAKKVGVPYLLLLAICTHESGGLKNILVQNDKGTPSYGVCQVKEGTARMFGFTGKAEDLMNEKLNVKIAAKYLKYQLDRYDNDWCKATAAYNSGTYIERRKKPGKPVNYEYIGLVQNQMDDQTAKMLECNAGITYGP